MSPWFNPKMMLSENRRVFGSQFSGLSFRVLVFGGLSFRNNQQKEAGEDLYYARLASFPV